MGQSSSSTLGTRGGRRRSLRDSIRSPKHKAHNSTGTLSAACNFMDVNRKFELLNVNTASEEELMTLPGINRATAHTIVEYRQAIGRFKKVEDLALVSGIGADKLDLIRPEICVSRRRNTSCASSRVPSTDSLLNSEMTRLAPRSSPARVVNINSASVFDLMAIHGFNQELAANVVHYRERRGPFRSVDDLIKVKGINQWRLGALRSQVVAESATAGKIKAATLTAIKSDSCIPPLAVPGSNTNTLQVPNGRVPGHRKTMSVPIKYSPLTNGLVPHKDIFDLLSAYTQRPIVEEDFRNERNGRPALRVASWNLTDFSADKADNPGVRETVCRTVLENSWSLIAVQEVCDTVSLKKICDELNYPSLRRVVDWRDDEGGWEYCMPVAPTATGYGLAFLYDTGNAVEQRGEMRCLTLEGCHSSTAVLATFQLADLSVCLVNVCLYDDNGLCMQRIKKALEGHVEDSDLVVILGDFSGINKSVEEAELQFKGVLPANSVTNSCPPSYQELRHFDNIYLGSETMKHSTGVWGVVRQGLSHLAIPRGWMWGGPASEHCPVWCELYTGSKPVALANGTSHIAK